ncbi:hypothetical protein HOLleu_35112 [Holothuria leucospilota]|uniref:Uncharacterized protein n=1 Tax=Holothuria leucospilota TaxID=206669 RepID=A0A9Q1BGN9_HOLLE|nr:hypothetical protein HOLleu_35112 [Holothuria leucospilota]
MHAKPAQIKVGDRVLLREKKRNKVSSPFNCNPYTVVEVKGSMTSAKRGEQIVRRNSSFFKPVNIATDAPIDDDDDCPTTPDSQQPPVTDQVPPDLPTQTPHPQRRVYPRRNRFKLLQYHHPLYIYACYHYSSSIRSFRISSCMN